MVGVTVEGRAAGHLLAQRDVLAHAVTDALYAESPDLLDRYGEIGRVRCHEDLRFTIDHLIPAVDLADPSLFVRYVEWLDDLLRARNVPTRDVARSLELTQRVVSDRLAPDEAAAVQRCIAAGLTTLGSRMEAGAR